MKRLAIFSSIALSLIVGACSLQSQKPNVVQSGDAQRIQSVRNGIVLEVLSVEIEGDRKFGTVIGGVLGSVIGNQAGRSQGSGTQGATTVAGGIAGDVLGNKLGNVLTRKNGVQLLIQLENGDTVSILQEADENVSFSPNQEVILIGDVNLRVIPKSKS